MPFTKKKEAERRKKVSEAVKTRFARAKAQKVDVQASSVLHAIGRRVVDFKLLSQSMWCDTCNEPLSFRYIIDEVQIGLASVYKVRCHRCLDILDVNSSATVPSDTEDARSLYVVNCKAALGCLDSGVGHEQLNKLLSAMNLPTIPHPTIKRAEKRMGRSVLQVAAQSCKDAIAKEKELSLQKRGQKRMAADVTREGSPDSPPSLSSATNRVLNDVTETPRSRRQQSDQVQQPQSGSCNSTGQLQDSDAADEEVEIVVSYDFGWDKRGSGFKYDSHSGRGTIVGVESGKVLGYEVISTYCAMCTRGHKPEDHECQKNYSGSSKGMEPHTAVNLIVKNSDLKQAKCKVTTVTLDKDSSTIAALNRASPHPLKRNIDVNHNLKSFNNALWKLKKGSHRFLTTEIINKLKVCLSYAIAQNKGNVDGVRNAINNIANHCFGEHYNCGDWCKGKDDPNYTFKAFPGGKPFTCPVWRKDLEGVLHEQANQAEELAACGSSLANESFNHMAVTRAPKSKHYCGSSANLLRVSTAVTHKNIGANHIDQIYRVAGLTPTRGKYRDQLQNKIVKKATYQGTISVKNRRLHLKMQNNWKCATAESREGLTYVSGMGSVMERAAAATEVTSWLPEACTISSSCKYVVVDIETTGLSANAEIVQIAAKCSSEEYNAYMLPTKQFSNEASEKTGMRKLNNRLWYGNECLQTAPPETAAKGFLDFLEACGSQVILVGHNIVRFDAPRIVKWMREFDLAKDLCQIVYGFTDTMPLIKQGKLQKQDLLAKKYLTSPEWTAHINGAHNAKSDCILLDGLLHHFQITEATIIQNALPIREFMERQVMAKKKKKNLPLLKDLTPYVSQMMIGRMASHGVTMEELIREYSTHQRKGLECCFGVQINGKPRVTNQKKIIDQVEKCVIQVMSR